LAGNTLLTAGVGAAVIYFSGLALIPSAIGVGIIAYAGAVAFYTLLGIWRMRRAALREARLQERNLSTDARPAPPKANQAFTIVCPREEAQPQGK